MEMKATITAKGPLFDGKAPEIIRKDLLSAMHEADALLVSAVKKHTPEGVYGIAGGLIATVFGEVVQYGTSFMDTVSHGSKYGDVIEYGRRPGKKMPPEGTLLRWVEIKTGLSGKAAEQVEFLIRRKIGKKGFEGAHMFEKAWNENQGKLKRIFDKAGFDIAFHLSEDK